jgi:hypothetical protein
MGFLLSKEDVRYHEIVFYSEVQDLFSFLVLIIVSKTSMYPLKPHSSRTNMTIEISSYEKFFAAKRF